MTFIGSPIWTAIGEPLRQPSDQGAEAMSLKNWEVSLKHFGPRSPEVRERGPIGEAIGEGALP